jgi:hypothetical protein
MPLTVYYTDGTEETYNSIEEAEEGVSETVFGCNFAVNVGSIEGEVNGQAKEYSVTWSVKIAEA